MLPSSHNILTSEHGHLASVDKTQPTKQQKTSTIHGTFKEKIKLKKYAREENDLMSIAQHQKLYELWKKAGVIKGEKTPESSRGLEARVPAIEAKTENNSDENLLSNENPNANCRNNPALDRKGSQTRQ